MNFFRKEDFKLVVLLLLEKYIMCICKIIFITIVHLHSFEEKSSPY